MKYLLVFISLFLISQVSNAIIVAQLDKAPLDNTKRTHILVTGFPGNLDEMFERAAITKARNFQRLYPKDQVLLIFTEFGEISENVTWLTQQGINVTSSQETYFAFSDTIDQIRPFSKIASLDFFTHSGVMNGLLFSEYNTTLGSDELFLDLKGHFTSEAYITLNGCNSGYYIASVLSRVLSVPVFGSFTSTDFQELHTDGNWYTEGTTQLPLDLNCKKNRCARMKPDNIPYHGIYGDYKNGGLPFYKQFCVGISDDLCLKALARFAIDFSPNDKLTAKPSFEAYKMAAQDVLCPSDKNPSTRFNCILNLEKNASSTYSPFNGSLLQCSLNKCDFSFKCEGYECSIDNPATQATTFIDEYNRYLLAYKSLGP